ncbi:hypothetical protein [Xanthobacter sp. ZOL 2024]
MSELWTVDEDQIVTKGFKVGLSDREIARSLNDAGFSRTMGSVSSRRSSLRLLYERRNRSGMWTPELDQILITCVLQRLGPTDMSKAVADAGYVRSPSSCSSRAERIGAYDDLDGVKTIKVISDPLAEALRKHHQGIESVRPSQHDRSVPMRMTGAIPFSVTGSHF